MIAQEREKGNTRTMTQNSNSMPKLLSHIEMPQKKNNEQVKEENAMIKII